MHQEEVDVPGLSDRLEHLEVAGRQPGEAEQREPWREFQEIGLGPQAAASLTKTLGWALRPDALSQEQPELDLPAVLAELRGAGGPALQHVRPVHRIAVEEVRHVPDAREPPGAILFGAGLLDVLGQRRQPGLVEMVLDDLDERPHRPLRHPRVQLRVGVECPRQGVRDQRARKGKSRCWRRCRPAVRRWHPGAPRAAASTSARCPGSAPRPPRPPSGHRADRPRAEPASRRGHRPARIGGGAAPRQSTSTLFPGDPLGKASCSEAVRATPCRCGRRPRAAPRWSIAPPRRRTDPADRSGGGGAPSRSGPVPRSRRTASPRHRGRGTCGR